MEETIQVHIYLNVWPGGKSFNSWIGNPTDNPIPSLTAMEHEFGVKRYLIKVDVPANRGVTGVLRGEVLETKGDGT